MDEETDLDLVKGKFFFKIIIVKNLFLSVWI
jgi:hypothetical protein